MTHLIIHYNEGVSKNWTRVTLKYILNCDICDHNWRTCDHWVMWSHEPMITGWQMVWWALYSSSHLLQSLHLAVASGARLSARSTWFE